MKYDAIKNTLMSYRNRLTIIVIGLGLLIISVLFTSYMAKELRDKEDYEVSIWAYAFGRYGELEFGTEDPLLKGIINNGNKIPFIIVDDKFSVRGYNRINDRIISHPDLLTRKLERLSRENTPMEINSWNGSRYYLFYGNSDIQKLLVYFPMVQLILVAIFIAFGFITFRSSQDDEQNKVWIGLAKETAHQLGTPISSLMGWLEYLRTQPIDQSMVDEMNKDLTRLMKVADRFSKIGSETILSPTNVNEVIGNSVMYFKRRIPKNVTLEYNGLAIAPVQAMLNTALFEWVVENLLKNSLDALQGQGSMEVFISEYKDWLYIDFKDSGKGISKTNFKKIFEPGFTTKTRGWGLGLSLSRRIVEEYHNGKIYVVESEIGKGTTIRIALKRLFE